MRNMEKTTVQRNERRSLRGLKHFRWGLCSLFAVVAAVSMQVRAAEQNADGLEEIIVRGYRLAESNTATRLDMPNIEVPQSIDVLSSALIQDRAAQSLSESLRSVPGFVARQEFRLQEAFSLRGFSVDGDTGVFRDGRRYTNQVTHDTELLERIEVLKGPASVLYGGLEPGGVINMVSKRPTPNSFLRVRQAVGKYDDYKTVVDASWAFSDRAGLRLPMSFRYANSFRDAVDDKRSINAFPVLEFRLSDATRLTLAGGYAKNDQVDDTIQIPLVAGRPADVPISRFYGEKGIRTASEQFSASVELAHEFANGARLRAAVNGHNTEVDFYSLTTFSIRADQRTINRSVFEQIFDNSLYGAQVDLSWEFRAFGARHQALVGAEAYSRRDDLHDLAFYPAFTPIDIYTPMYGGVRLTPPLFTGVNDDRGKLAGLYVQDLITLIEGRPGVHKTHRAS